MQSYYDFIFNYKIKGLITKYMVQIHIWLLDV